jgi:uncharacterized protein
MHLRDTAGADLTVVLGFSAKHLGVVVPNELIAGYAASVPGRFIGFAGLEPTAPNARRDSGTRTG